MSKIYKKYTELKSNSNYDENTLFLFKTGLFFIFIDKDARLASSILNLKLGQLNDTIVKCGFPVNSLQKYLNLLKNTSYKIEIVTLDNNKSSSVDDYINNEELKSIVEEILAINIDNLSISQAYDFLYNLQNRASIFNKES